MPVGNTFFSMSQSTPKTCVLNVVPPVFSGIATLVAQTNGALDAAWPSANDVDGDNPVEYLVYVKKSTATGIYLEKPLLTYETQLKIMALADGSLLESAQYFVAVRAKDSEQNVDSNTAVLSAVSVGVLDSGLADAVQAMKAVAQAVAIDLIGTVDDGEIVGTIDADDELVGELKCEV